MFECVCVECNSPFTHINKKRKTCSRACKLKRQRSFCNKWRQSKPKGYRRDEHRRWVEANPEQVRSNHYRLRYGLSLTDLDAFMHKQNNACAICGRDIKLRGVKGQDLAVVDHCHTTKKVRGMLCTTCNLAIGYMKDSTKLLEAAIKYLGDNN